MKKSNNGQMYKPGTFNLLANWYICLNILFLFLFPVVIFTVIFYYISGGPYTNQQLLYLDFYINIIQLLALMFSVVLLIITVIIFILLYRFWNIIQSDKARTTPAKAVIFCLIPIFNIFWLYVVLPGLAKDMNKYCENNNLDVPKMSIRLAWFCCILIWISFIPYIQVLVGLLIPFSFMIIVKKFAKKGRTNQLESLEIKPNVKYVYYHNIIELNKRLGGFP